MPTVYVLRRGTNDEDLVMIISPAEVFIANLLEDRLGLRFLVSERIKEI